MIKGKNILVTGGAGSIGSEIVRQLAPNNSVYILDINETGVFDLYEELKHKGYKVDYMLADITNRATMDGGAINEFDIIFHAAAFKHVSPLERYSRRAVENNVIGLLNVLQDFNGKFIFISTDKAVNPTTVMGASKHIGELIVRNAGGISVRFGNVMGSRGSVLPLWQNSIDKGEDLNVTDERMTRYMMTIPEAVGLVIEAAEKGKPGETWIMDMGEPVNVLDLAKGIIKESGKEVGINMIGKRPGESLHEQLMTVEEEKVAKKVGKFFVI